MNSESTAVVLRVFAPDRRQRLMDVYMTLPMSLSMLAGPLTGLRDLYAKNDAGDVALPVQVVRMERLP